MELEGERINPGSPSMPGTVLALESGRGHLSFREWAFKKSFIWFSPRLGFAGVKISSLVPTTCWVQVNNQAEPHAFEHLSGSLSLLPYSAYHLGVCSFWAGRADLLRKHE